MGSSATTMDGLPAKARGDADALLLAPRELARPAPGEVARQLNEVKEAQHPLLDLVLFGLDAELPDDAGNLAADGVARVEGVVGVLEDHLHRAELLGRALAHRQIADVLAVETDLAVGAALEAHQHLGEGRFAATGFADDAEGLAAPGGKTEGFVGLDVADAVARDKRPDRAIMDLVVLLHADDLEHRLPDLDRRFAFGLGDRLVGIDVPPAHAADPVAGIVVRGHGLDADVAGIAKPSLEEVAAGAEVAPRRPIVGQRKLALDGDQGARVLVGVGQRDAAEQAGGVRMLGPGEDRIDGPLSITSPEYMTQMRSQTSSMRPRLWEM